MGIMIPEIQTAVVQSNLNDYSPTTHPCLAISHSVPVPTLSSPYHLLVRVLAVALNPTDHKMITHFPTPNQVIGCDFCGIVEQTLGTDETAAFPLGTRVCGGTFPYSHSKTQSGAFAQWTTVDCRLLLRVPDTMDDLQGAALGGVSWGTAGLAFYDPMALALQGRPSQPVQTNEPVLVYGGATASGTMACQLLKLSGYSPIAVTSPTSAPLAIKYGATNTAPYTSPGCAEIVRSLADGKPIRRAMDCITSAESVAICFAALARTGGRYACLEGLDSTFKTRRAVRTKEVMGFEGLGVPIHLMGQNSSCYSREVNEELFEVTIQFAVEMQALIDGGLIRAHPVLEVEGCWEGILRGLAKLQKGMVRGQKLVVRIATQ